LLRSGDKQTSDWPAGSTDALGLSSPEAKTATLRLFRSLPPAATPTLTMDN